MKGILESLGRIGAKLATRKYTAGYPEVKPELPARYRARIVLTRDPDGQERCVACNLCAGTGVITTELKEHWLDRDTFGSIIVPDADLWKQGKLHAVAREQYSGGVQVDG